MSISKYAFLIRSKTEFETICELTGTRYRNEAKAAGNETELELSHVLDYCGFLWAVYRHVGSNRNWTSDYLFANKGANVLVLWPHQKPEGWIDAPAYFDHDIQTKIASLPQESSLAAPVPQAAPQPPELNTASLITLLTFHPSLAGRKEAPSKHDRMPPPPGIESRISECDELE
ncbi:hypothetical protein HDU91_000761 [Kappamyces sp. JEL0680]|nr:hypothetical protein HDU91_000761 [Kappamyces sp. JEL0680]